MARWDSLAKRDELHGLNRHGQRLSDDDMRESPYCIERPHTGFRWNDGDWETIEWYPQGIAGITNADQSKKFLLVSWYHQNREKKKDKLGFKGVRVSLVDVTDMDDIWYRHVLLVERDGASIKPLTNAAGHSIHAGGIAVLGTTLYVADSANNQIRSFDLSRLVAAAPDTGKSRCEKTADGTYYAYDYRYLMIQQAARSVTPALLSFMSMDWSNPTSPSLLTGGFYYPDKGYDTSPSVRWWRPEDIVNATTALTGERTPPGLAGTLKDRFLGEKAQGVTRVGDRLWVSRSYGDGNQGKLAVFNIANPSAPKSLGSASWPIGAEGIFAAKTSDNVWCCTEFPEKRIVFAVKKSAYP